MIQLANDPHASRSFQRAAASGVAAKAEAPRVRGGHAWPFPSRHAARPAREENTHKPAAQDRGS